MQLQEILIEDKTDIRTAIERLERVRCKVVYLIDRGKLVASLSDGDVRRYVLQEKDTRLSVKEIANYKPVYLLHYEKEKLNSIFSESDLYSVPIVNYNQEIIEIVFRDGRRIKRQNGLTCPIVMMAGGKGTRLYPYTKILPKALIPIGDIPISERIIDRFFECGCRQFYMVVNHKKNMIQSYFDSIDKDYEVSYVEEDRPLGTGGGLYLLEGSIDRDFFLVNCDIIIDADYSEIFNFHQKEENFITIVAACYTNTIPYGVIECDHNTLYRDMIEKPESRYLINTGMYLVKHELLETIPHEKEISFPDLITYYQSQGKKIGVYTVEESAYMDMGQLEELDKMRKKLNT